MLLKLKRDEFISKKRYDKLLRLIKKYNKIATKYKHKTIEYDEFNLTIDDYYHPDTLIDKKTFMTIIKTMVINCYLNRLYQKIWKLNLTLIKNPIT